MTASGSDGGTDAGGAGPVIGTPPPSPPRAVETSPHRSPSPPSSPACTARPAITRVVHSSQIRTAVPTPASPSTAIPISPPARPSARRRSTRWSRSPSALHLYGPGAVRPLVADGGAGRRHAARARRGDHGRRGGSGASAYRGVYVKLTAPTRPSNELTPAALMEHLVHRNGRQRRGHHLRRAHRWRSLRLLAPVLATGLLGISGQRRPGPRKVDIQNFLVHSSTCRTRPRRSDTARERP